MRSFENVTIALSMLFACTGSVCILIFSLTQNHQDIVLLSAVVATSISLAMLLVSLFFILPATFLTARPIKFRLIAVHPGAVLRRDMPAVQVPHNQPASPI